MGVRKWEGKEAMAAVVVVVVVVVGWGVSGKGAEEVLQKAREECKRKQVYHRIC